MKKRAFRKLYKDLFYISQHEKLPDKVFRCRMAISLLTILACTAVMVTSTFALFYMGVSTENSTIASAFYSVTVGDTEESKYICPLVYEDKHTFEIKADGTATTGYCKIQVGEQIYYTEQIPQGSSLMMTVQAAQGTPIIFAPQWGTSSNYLNVDLCVDEIIHSATSYVVYKVEPTATLTDIAAYYSVSEEDILVYNNLSDVAVDNDLNGSNAPLLTVGMELKIPGAADKEEPYKVPYATYIVEPTAILEAISAHYDVPVVDIVMYNGSVEMTAGFELKIPGVSPDTPSYVAPVPDAPVSTEENKEGVIPDENIDPPEVDDVVSGGDIDTGQQATIDTFI